MIEDVGAAAPALCRLQLAVELRRLRIARGVTASEVAKRLVVSPSKINRLEAGENGVVEPADVIALCEIYAAEPELRATLVGYATVTKTKKDWWQEREYAPVIPPGFKAYLGQEATASALHNYEAEYVPGLLQTEPYIRALHRRAHEGLSQEEIDRLVAVRTTRQEVLHRKDSPLRLIAILNEAVLRRRVGSADVMREQLQHIADIASSLPNVRVQVVPFEAGEHPGMNGAFTILQFRERDTFAPIVYLENLSDAWVVRKQADVDRYEEAFTDLQAFAPGHPESLSMIKKAIEEF
ncbi:helix-turn-helix domain-containing protein [Streptomyces griseorubiginosus]|uniref:helix-turn-helix domain-containing protein n=1 Tax=Streptomyces griseorubiginosus TaxID=67304 RepID=UPI001AD6B462|nr:helix-turn-helix transcriptional regulator [Streptomyces griseorubiginosus]MBO4258700.1 helix-turn-helix domain-containing protein [Streptomyces griseorubiginosus]